VAPEDYISDLNKYVGDVNFIPHCSDKKLP